MHDSRTPYPFNLSAVGLVIMLAALWLVMRGYQGLTGDAQIYAFQALAALKPQLAGDLYLANTSQDQFTIFSPFYAFFIDRLGLESAARILTLLFTAWLLVAAWRLARALSGADYAWPAVAALLIIPSDYGASGVFHFAEPFLTARLPAEALTVTALAVHFAGRKSLGLALAAAALLIHPLIALPACLVLICLTLPGRMGALGAAAATLTTAALAAAAAAWHPAAHLFTVMDSPWLEVVRERSQFLFLDLWTLHDWDLNLRPFCYLAFTWLVVRDGRVRKLCAVAALVAAAGFAVALIASVVGPVAVLVQGQAWRWVWIAVLVAALLLPVTAASAWREENCGPVCVILLLAGWMMFDGSACAAAALVIWQLRTWIGRRYAPLFRAAAIVLGGICAGWFFVKTWGIVKPHAGSAAAPLAELRQIFALRLPALLLVLVCWQALFDNRLPWRSAALCLVLIAFSLAVFPGAFSHRRPLESPAEIAKYASWIDAIPPTSTVLVVPAVDVGQFVWFTLGRPNYLSVDQSAGVIFSRDTALEVTRRSNILLPVMSPNWKIRTALQSAAAGIRNPDAAGHSLTTIGLAQICRDPRLGFVISPQAAGFDAIRHDGTGPFEGWNLYDCGKIEPRGSI